MNPRSRQANIVTQEFEDEVVIYDLETNKAFVLNETCAFVWRNCDGKQEVAEISLNLAQKHRQPVNEDIVWLTIDELKKNNLIENSENLKSRFEGLKRREIIKKIGLSTMIVLPMISIMVAPTSVDAQSGTACIANNNTCIFSNYTQSNCCPGSRCDEASAPPIIGSCMNCFGPNQSFGGTGASIPACDALPTKNLCCNPTGTPMIGSGFCGCP
ncbi:MAG: PqqD family protein [Pyrinomonadaceae bacterium]|nr:PqqD family protein [Pyrinomonadaceae bacterium]